MEYTKIENIRENPSNPRTITKEKFAKLVKSIKEFPKMLEIRPLVIDKNGFVLGGNMRLKALKELGYTEVPVVRVENLTDEEQKRFIITDNLSFGEWDWDRLANEWDQTQLEEWGLLETPMLPDEKDDVMPESVPVVSVLGDLYEIGGHRVLCGDSTKIEDVERLMNGSKADMTFTDPPYGVSYEKKAGEILGRTQQAKIEGDDLSTEDLQKVVGTAFKNIASSLKNGGSYYVCSPQGGELGLMMMMRDAGIECRHMIIWSKDSPVFSMGRLDYDYQHEPILYGWRGSHKFVGGGTHKTSIWNVPRPRSSKLHPTMKPVEVVVNAIQNSAKGDDIVLDLFLGSGTSVIASQKVGTLCYGMEIDPHYVDVIVQRWVDYTGIETIKKNGVDIEWKKSPEQTL